MALRKALKDRNNFLASKAAAMTEELRLAALIPDLAAAFHRFLQDAVKSDPQCWAKNAIAQALKNLEYGEADVFLRGIVHEQWEPVWGGKADAAITLRGTCAHALIGCGLPSFELLRHLGDRLADHSKVVRVEAARAIGSAGAMDGALLLRLKVRCGDPEPEVIGQCLSSLLGMELRWAVDFAMGYLDHDDLEWRIEASAALAESREARAVEAVIEYWKREKDVRARGTILRLLAASPLEQAGDFLVTVTNDGPPEMAREALAALRESRHRGRLTESGPA